MAYHLFIPYREIYFFFLFRLNVQYQSNNNIFSTQLQYLVLHISLQFFHVLNSWVSAFLIQIY